MPFQKAVTPSSAAMVWRAKRAEERGDELIIVLMLVSSLLELASLASP